MRSLSEVDLDRCVTEVCVMASCNHRNIIQYVEAFVDSGCLQIIMEYAKGGGLFWDFFYLEIDFRRFLKSIQI